MKKLEEKIGVYLEAGTGHLYVKQGLGEGDREIAVQEFIDVVDTQGHWTDTFDEVWEVALSHFGLEMQDYEDAEGMWEDFLRVAGSGGVK